MLRNSVRSAVHLSIHWSARLNPNTLFSYKNLIYENIKASKYPRIKNVVVVILVAIFIFILKNEVFLKTNRCIFKLFLPDCCEL